MVSYLWNQGAKAASIPEASCPCMRGCVTLDMGKSVLFVRAQEALSLEAPSRYRGYHGMPITSLLRYFSLQPDLSGWMAG